MKYWEHAITVHTLGDILAARKGESGEPTPRILYCDSGAKCFFDDTPNPQVQAMVDILNQRGREGWELVQIIPRLEDMICFWRRPVE
ncbi:MAG: DUF4177 domain-containing protein [Chloroflexi bacterium]|jgi:hypothetical protein|nr:DUF4177 domain-containing protein [Chloroflexota bacterium]